MGEAAPPPLLLTGELRARVPVCRYHLFVDRIPAFDGHNDTLLNLHLSGRGGGRGFFERSNAGHVDLPRARDGGFGGGFFACWTPPDPESSWTEESALILTEDGYEVADAPPLDPTMPGAPRRSWRRSCSGSSPGPEDG